jgi:iron complex outermembrane recepter protein
MSVIAFGLVSSQTVSGTEQPLLAQVQELSRMSLEDLTRVEVTSVLKSPQLLNAAAASIYVITSEDIVRTGVLSVPEALRLAPNLHVEQITSNSYAISARGFNDHREVQTQANKLLILVDGRTVYSPLFSGVFYDAIDVMMDDIERIEVISGPGATLWGANAMNGVINIITKPASATNGALVRLDAGTSEQAASARFGGSVRDALTYRVYGKAFDRDPLEEQDGSGAQDRWNKYQGGFRVDWRDERNSLTVQGDLYQAEQDFPGSPNLDHTGENVLVRWSRQGARSETMVQAYYDHTDREAPVDGAPFSLDTYDLELQQTWRLGARHSFTWGAGKRLNDYHVRSHGQLQFLPANRRLDLGNVFIQDVVSLPNDVTVTAGVKLEDNPFLDVTALPDLRISWAPDERNLLWAAASRAIRAPTPFDVDVAEFLGPTLFLEGNPDFASEKVWAYEIGYRGQPNAALSFSISSFYHDYEQLRTIELGPTGIPLVWDNRMAGNTYGLEAWANIQVRSWWRLSPGIRTLEKRLHFDASSSQLVGLSLAGNDPSFQAALRSSMDLAHAVTFDAFLRYVGAMPEPRQPEYYELSARVAWRATPKLTLAVNGFNLLHSRHREYPAPIGKAIPRSVFAEARFSF